MPASYHSSLVEGQWFFNNLLDENRSGILSSTKWKSEFGSAPCISGHLTSADAVRVRDDVAVRCLPEHFGEPHNSYNTALEQVLKHRARSDRGKLVYVPDQNPSRSPARHRS
jgi:hypothetical protein